MVAALRMPPASERWFSLAYAFWLFGVFAYFMPAATWNPVSRFDLTRALVEERTLSIDSYSDNTGDRAFSKGRWYTDKAPIPSLLAAPVYALLHVGDRLRGSHPAYRVVSTEDLPALRVYVNDSFERGLYASSLSTAGAATTMAGVLLFQLLRRRFSPRAALIGSATTVLATPLFPYATSFYGHAVAAAFLIGALVAIAEDPDMPPSRARLRTAGACLALSVGSEYITAVPGLVIALFALRAAAPGTRLRSIFDLATGSLGPVLLIGAYHSACFGAPWRTGYSFIQRAEFARGHASGLFGVHVPAPDALYGLLFGERRGLFLISPVALPAIALTLIHARARRDRSAWAGLVALCALLLANGGYYMWWGGAAVGPRHLVPVLGFIAFGAAACFEDRRLRWLFIPLALVSFANALTLTAVGVEGPEYGNLLFDYGYRRLLNGEIASLSGASNLAIRLGLARAASLGPLLVWILMGGRFLLRHVDMSDEAAEQAPRVEPAE
jgi:hypothetical protein